MIDRVGCRTAIARRVGMLMSRLDRSPSQSLPQSKQAQKHGIALAVPEENLQEHGPVVHTRQATEAVES